MGQIGCPKTSVRNCRYTLRNILEERRSHRSKLANMTVGGEAKLTIGITNS